MKNPRIVQNKGYTPGKEHLVRLTGEIRIPNGGVYVTSESADDHSGRATASEMQEVNAGGQSGRGEPLQSGRDFAGPDGLAV
jgi:hypothetical protein